jgi:hypothetical protein
MKKKITKHQTDISAYVFKSAIFEREREREREREGAHELQRKMNMQ